MDSPDFTIMVPVQHMLAVKELQHAPLVIHVKLNQENLAPDILVKKIKASLVQLPQKKLE